MNIVYQTLLHLNCFPNLNIQAEIAIDSFIKKIENYQPYPEIIIKTIEIRRKFKFKLSDSIIIAIAKF